MGWLIVAHSFRLLFRNLGDALKISLGPYLIAALACGAIGLAVGIPTLRLAQGGMPAFQATAAMGGAYLVAILAFAVILLFTSSWVAVSWHRFVLLSEYPGILPALAGRPIWAYLGRVILLSLILMLISIPLGFLVGLVMIPFMNGAESVLFAAAMVVGLLMGTILAYFSLRFALVLPAISVDRPISFGDSWSITGRLSGAIFGAVLILTFLNIAIVGILGLVLGDNVIAAILGLIVDWVSLMVGISILTTLYGHLVEGRTID